jgi:hypothetical protein
MLGVNDPTKAQVTSGLFHDLMICSRITDYDRRYDWINLNERSSVLNARIDVCRLLQNRKNYISFIQEVFIDGKNESNPVGSFRTHGL